VVLLEGEANKARYILWIHL